MVVYYSSREQLDVFTYSDDDKLPVIEHSTSNLGAALFKKHLIRVISLFFFLDAITFKPALGTGENLNTYELGYDLVNKRGLTIDYLVANPMVTNNKMFLELYYL
eukprot:TRINITY_DN24574_c0_g1_i1.p1 TRINITY_DN24574_c0_g1~~TRINITY_DN24574_c0_g1_i1.p1  ORF type:complete len:105 (+),score=12.72 TRINITY_DN24574_c0_g1_i1:1199-1513(+)